jgi:spore germination protein GerM
MVTGASDGSARIRAFVEQLLYTASEEPGIISVLITQNGGETAIIGGEGLIVDRPTTRAAFSR